MAKSSPDIVLELTIGEELGRATSLSIAIDNRSAKALTVVTAPRYFKVELVGDHGQFVNGESSLVSSLPGAKDYRSIAAHAKETLLVLPIRWTADSPGDVSIGPFRFTDVRSGAKARVTYKAADRIMPNLPERERRSFFPGPADGVSAPIAF